jgi:hypothetical protein
MKSFISFIVFCFSINLSAKNNYSDTSYFAVIDNSFSFENIDTCKLKIIDSLLILGSLNSHGTEVLSKISEEINCANNLKIVPLSISKNIQSLFRILSFIIQQKKKYLECKEGMNIIGINLSYGLIDSNTHTETFCNFFKQLDELNIYCVVALSNYNNNYYDYPSDCHSKSIFTVTSYKQYFNNSDVFVIDLSDSNKVSYGNSYNASIFSSILCKLNQYNKYIYNEIVERRTNRILRIQNIDSYVFFTSKFKYYDN